LADIFDISQTLETGISVWPGDEEFATFWTMRKDDDCPVNVGGVTMSLHTGTHADTPKHFRDDGDSPDQVDLGPYLGLASVIDLTGFGWEELSKGIKTDQLHSIGASRPERVLLRTGLPSPSQFPEKFPYLTAEAAEFFINLGVKLVGLDTPSVDQIDSKSLTVHHLLDRAGVAILENLRLDHVKAGRYELIALPLKLAGMDASPVRAILRTLD